MSERDLPPLNDETRALIEAGRDDGPPAQARGRVLQRLQATLGLPGPGGPGGGQGAGPAAGAEGGAGGSGAGAGGAAAGGGGAGTAVGTGAAVGGGLLKPVAIVVGALGVGAVVTTVALVSNPLQDGHEEAWVTTPQKQTSVESAGGPAAEPTPELNTADRPLPARHTVTRLKTARRRRHRREREQRSSASARAAEKMDKRGDTAGGSAANEMPLGPAPDPLPPPPPVDTTLGDEQALLDRARAVLRAGQARRAQSLVQAHRRRYAAGKLAEERDALAIRILVRLGQRAKAKRQAEAFRRRYPRSMLLPVVERALNAPADR